MSTDKEFIFEVTEEDYQEGLAKGWTEDDMMPVGKHRFRRARHIKKGDKAKRRVTMYIDTDIVDYFQKRASEPNAAPYQSQINQALRSLMENNPLEKTDLKNELLEDDEFLKKLKEKLAA